MDKKNRKAPAPIHNENISPAEVEALIREELRQRIKAFLQDPNTSLLGEKFFLEKEIEQWNRGIEKAEHLHFQHYHSYSNPSVFLHEIGVFRLNIKVAEERLSELTNQVLQSGRTSASVSRNNAPAGAYAVMHVYLAKTGGQPITRNNKDELGEKYGFSGNMLFKAWNKFKDDSQRLHINTSHKGSSKTLIAHFESAISFLPDDSEAKKLAIIDLQRLKDQYNKHFN